MLVPLTILLLWASCINRNRNTKPSMVWKHTTPDTTTGVSRRCQDLSGILTPLKWFLGGSRVVLGDPLVLIEIVLITYQSNGAERVP